MKYKGKIVNGECICEGTPLKRKKRMPKKTLVRAAIPKRLPKQYLDPLQKEGLKLLGKNSTPERVNKFLNFAIDKAARGKSSTAARYLKELSKPLSYDISGRILRMIRTPVSGVVSPPGVQSVMEESSSIHRLSGANNTLHAREHRINFKTGLNKRRWIKQTIIENGEVNRKLKDTTEDFPLEDLARNALLIKAGANRKMQKMVDPDYFGFSHADLQSFFDITSHTGSTIREQIAYGAISKLVSKSTITNMNKYIPVHVKASLLRPKVVGVDPITQWLKCFNTTTTVQIEGAIPLYTQLTNSASSSIFGNTQLVDPKSKGVKASEVFNSSFEVVESKKVKLLSGDRLKINYEHLCGSGVRLDKLHGMQTDTGFSTKHPVTYMLFLEMWGEEVDVMSNTSTSQIIKATAPVAVQFEYEKIVHGVRPSTTAADMQTSAGYTSNHFAVKLYSKSPLVTTNRRWNDSYANLGTTYIVPVMSDSTNRDGGQIT